MSRKHNTFTFKLVVVGDGACGKTSIIDRFVHDKFKSEYRMSIGMQPSVKHVSIEDVVVALSIWDIAGQERFKFIRKTFFRGATAALLVFDLTREVTLENLSVWNDDLLAGVGGKNIYKIMVGNKSDLTDKRMVERSTALEYKEAMDCDVYLESSALTGENVDNAFKEAAGLLAQKSQRQITSPRSS